MISKASAEIEYILEYYPIGHLDYYKQDERGYCNTNFAIKTEQQGHRKKYFFRRYKSEIQEEELRFEHSLIEHLVKCNFDLVPALIKTRDGKSYVRQIDEADPGRPVFYAIFEFLDGEDRYTWVNPHCGAGEIVNAAAVLARFHKTVYGFTPEGRKYQPKISDLLPEVSSTANKILDKRGGTVFDECLANHLELIERNVTQTRNELFSFGYQGLLQLVNHGDFHPGNLKFEDDQVVALLDFDWSKIEARCFDVALAIYYFFTDWEAGRDGQFRSEQAALFLNAYQDSLIDGPGLGPLDDVERKCLPSMLVASNLYVLNWTLSDFLNQHVDPEEYLVYLEHAVNLVKWLEIPDNRRALESIST